MDPSHYKCTEFLSQEESPHKEDIGIPAKSYAAKKPEGNNKGNRNMNGKEPLAGEALYICPPVSEWDIQQKNQDAYENEFSHAFASNISNYSGIAGMFQICKLSSTVLKAISRKYEASSGSIPAISEMSALISPKMVAKSTQAIR